MGWEVGNERVKVVGEGSFQNSRWDHSPDFILPLLAVLNDPRLFFLDSSSSSCISSVHGRCSQVTLPATRKLSPGAG